MTLDEFFISIGLKTDGVKQGMNEIESTMSQGISNITSKLGALSAAITAAFSVGQLFSQYTQQADEMGKLADAIEVDIGMLDAWGEAVARAGGTSQGFQQTLQALSGQLARQGLTGHSRAAMVLEGAGIDAGEIGRQRQAFDVLMDLAEKAEEMNKAEFFGLGRSLGLDTGTIMLLQQGRTALKDAIAQQKELGVWTKEDARITADFNDRIGDLGQVLSRFSAIVFKMILPAMTSFVRYLNQFINFLRKHETFVKAFFIGLATVITAYALPALASMAAAMLASPITWMVAGIAALALAVEDLVVWTEGGESAFDGLWTAIFGSPDEAIAAFDALQKKIEECSENADVNIRRSFGFFGLMLNATDTTFQEFVSKMVEGINKLAESTKNTCDLIRSFFEAVFDWVMSKVDAVISKFKEMVNPFANFLNTKVAEGAARIGNVTPISYTETGVDSISAVQALPGASFMGNRTTDTRVTVGTVNITAADGTDAANQFMGGIEDRAAAWTANADGAY
jgi:hypothetical protein